MKTSRTGSIVAFVFSGLFVVAALWLFFNRQYAQDWLAVQSYTPSSEIVAINEKAQFTEKGNFIFYATQPRIASQEVFNKECPRREAASPILGCYTNEDRIYVYNLTNDQLDGMEEVTAVHEMLHAVWYRMSKDEQQKLTTELQAAYEKLNDPELKIRMDYYERTEPGEFANELHAILGTEVSSLSPELEQYYSQYFNRDAVLKLHQQYKAVYDKLTARANSLYASMQTLSSSIQSRSTAYDAAAEQLTADINSFNTRARSGEFSSQSQFNAERTALIRRTAALEAERNSLNKDIATYSTYYDEYQEISKQIELLNDSIDSFKEIEKAPSV